MNVTRTFPAFGAMARSRRALLAGAAAVAIAIGGLTSATMLNAPAIAQTAPLAGPAVNPARPFSFADVIERVKPAVVSVKIRSMPAADRLDSDDPRADLPPGHPMERFFDRFGPQGPQGRMQPPAPRGRGFITGQGSGFIISADGYVVTNYHVVDGAREVDVVGDDGKTYTATVVGTDRRTDLALLKIKGDRDFPYVAFAPKPPRVGDWVLAIGNPFGLGGTVTAGIVSARGRDIGANVSDDFLQIDAAVNRGNSGGPTFDIDGNVVGVNTAIFSPSGGNVGIAFAIPGETVQRVVAALKDGGTVERGFLGLDTRPVGDDAERLGLKDQLGALVANIYRDSPAAKAGMRQGDVIRSLNGAAIRDGRDLARRVGELKPGASAELVVWREGKEMPIAIEVGRRPADSFDNQQPRRRG